MNNINISLNSTLPEPAMFIMGSINGNYYNIEHESLTNEEKKLVDNVILILNNKITNTFYNHGLEYWDLDLGIFQQFTDLEEVCLESDFELLPEQSKNYIIAFINLILLKLDNQE